MHSIEQLAGSEAEMAPAVAQYIRSKQRETFLTQFPSLKANWLSKSKEAKPALTPTHFLEFIPGLPIVLPKITGRGGKRYGRKAFSISFITAIAALSTISCTMVWQFP